LSVSLRVASGLRIRRYGLALEDVVGRGRSTTQVDTTERLGPNDQSDAALIAVRRDSTPTELLRSWDSVE